MAAPKAVRTKAGTTRPASSVVQVPLNEQDLVDALAQAQATINALITAYNAHTHARAACVWTGLVVTAGSADTVDVTAGEVRKADGTFLAVALVDELALSAGHATLARKDLVQVHTTTAVVSKKNGIASATPVAPAVDAGNIALAVVDIAALAVTPGTITDVRARFADATTASLVDGTAQAATNLFTPTP